EDRKNDAHSHTLGPRTSAFTLLGSSFVTCAASSHMRDARHKQTNKSKLCIIPTRTHHAAVGDRLLWLSELKMARGHVQVDGDGGLAEQKQGVEELKQRTRRKQKIILKQSLRHSIPL